MTLGSVPCVEKQLSQGAGGTDSCLDAQAWECRQLPLSMTSQAAVIERPPAERQSTIGVYSLKMVE